MDNNTNTIGNAEAIKNLKGITYAYLNIRSLYKHFDDVKMFLDKTGIDVLLLGEAFLNYSVTKSELEIDKYTLYRYDRDLGTGRRSGGGLVAYVRNHYNFELMENWSICTYDVEYIWLKLNLKDTRPTYISAVYRPPSGNLVNALELIENKINDINGDRLADIVILGDWNVDLKSNAQNTKQYKEFIKENRLSQLINSPTRISKDSATLIDHILVNRPEMYFQHGTYDPGLSDHHMVITSRKRAKVHRPRIDVYTRSYR